MKKMRSRILLALLLSLCMYTCSSQKKRFTGENFKPSEIVEKTAIDTSAIDDILHNTINSLKDTKVQEVTIKDNAEMVLKSNRADGFIPVSFDNNYENETITVYWIKNIHTDQAESVKIGLVLPKATMNASAVVGHSFYAVVNDGQENARDASPKDVTVFQSVRSYDFGPVYRPRNGLHPAVKPHDTSYMKIWRFKVKNMLKKTLKVWIEDSDGDKVFLCTLPKATDEYLNTVEDSAFQFTAKGDDDTVLLRVEVNRNVSLVVVTDPEHPPKKSVQEKIDKQLLFYKHYLNWAGVPWNQYYDFENSVPRNMVSAFAWSANRVGDVHQLHSSEGFWRCDGPKQSCQSTQAVPLSLEVISTKPKIFIVKDFASDYEVEAIKAYAAPQLGSSAVGETVDKNRARTIRNSRTAWVPRDSMAVTESIYRRAAELLQVPEEFLRNQIAAEHLQVVHYHQGMKYEWHHDFSDQYPGSRYITMIIYLSDKPEGESGGETAFRGMKVHPGKGSAVMFYNLLPDGNGDEATIHAALEVTEGEKWIANLWIWDPKMH